MAFRNFNVKIVTFIFVFYQLTVIKGGTRWCIWLRHCTTSLKVAGLILDGVTGIFHWHNLSSSTMALGSTQLLTEMSTRNISWGVKAAGAQGWQPYHLNVPNVLKSGSLNLLEPSGPVQSVMGLLYLLQNQNTILNRLHYPVLSEPHASPPEPCITYLMNHPSHCYTSTRYDTLMQKPTTGPSSKPVQAILTMLLLTC